MQYANARVILITGASGLIGSRLCEAFAREFVVVALDVKPPQKQIDRVEFIQVDLTEDDDVRAKLADIHDRFGASLASVIHLAAYYDFSGEPSTLYRDLTVEGTRRLLQSLRQLQFQVEQFVFSSTLLVMMPDPDGGTMSEQSPTRAEWAYPQSKLEAEEIIRQERGEIPVVILRIAGGYDDLCHSLPLSHQIARIYEEQFESHVFPGDLSHGQAMIHLDDLTDCFVRVVASRQQLMPVELFLIAEPDVMSYGDLQQELGRLIHGHAWRTVEVPKSVAKAGAWVQEKLASDEHKSFIRPWMIDLADDHYQPMIGRARSALQWEPQHRLRDTLPDMIEFLKRDPEAFYKQHHLPVPAGGLKAERVG